MAERPDGAVPLEELLAEIRLHADERVVAAIERVWSGGTPVDVTTFPEHPTWLMLALPEGDVLVTVDMDDRGIFDQAVDYGAATVAVLPDAWGWLEEQISQL